MVAELQYVPPELELWRAEYRSALERAYQTGRRDEGYLREFRAKHAGSRWLNAEDAREIEDTFLRELAARTAELRRAQFRAALVVASGGGRIDDPTLAQLEQQDFVLPFPDDDSERQRWYDEFDRALKGHQESLLRKADPSEAIIESLMNEEISCLVLIFPNDAGIEIATITVDDAGSLVVRGALDSPIAWAKCISGLEPLSAPEIAFVLAGGFNEATCTKESVRSSIESSLVQAVGVQVGHARGQPNRAARAAGDTAGCCVLVVDRAFGRAISQLIVEALEAREWNAHLVHPRPDAGGPTPKEYIEFVLASAPLRYAYALMGAAVDPRTGEVWTPEPPVLFPKGYRARRDGGSVRKVIPGGAVSCERVMLPVLALRGSDPTAWPVVALGEAPVQPSPPTSVTFTLAWPGNVRFEPPATQRDLLSLAEICDKVPQHVSIGSAKVDLVCIVDLTGTQDQVDKRRMFAQELVSSLNTAYGTVGVLRVSVLGYGDDVHGIPSRTGLAERRVFDSGDFASPTDAHQILQGLTAVDDPHQDVAAALEDALVRLEGRNWRLHSHRLVITIGARPPHPPAQEAGITPCDFKHDWRASLNYLREVLGIKTIFVHCAPPPPPAGVRIDPRQAEYVKRAIENLGILGFFRSEQSTPQQVAQCAARLTNVTLTCLPLAQIG
jgi:hypothetical protein